MCYKGDKNPSSKVESLHSDRLVNINNNYYSQSALEILFVITWLNVR